MWVGMGMYVVRGVLERFLNFNVLGLVVKRKIEEEERRKKEEEELKKKKEEVMEGEEKKFEIFGDVIVVVVGDVIMVEVFVVVG